MPHWSIFVQRERETEKRKRKKRGREREKKGKKRGEISTFLTDVSQVPQSHYVNKQLEISPCLPQLEKAHTQQGRPSTVPP